MNKQIDCRGLACPLPVIETKKALAGLTGDYLTVIVDNQTAKENVVKFAASQQCGVSVEAQAEVFTIRITKSTDAQHTSAQAAGTVWLITQDTLGHGNKELGAVLMKSFFFTLTEQPLPLKVLFLNSGVLLTVDDSRFWPIFRLWPLKGSKSYPAAPVLIIMEQRIAWLLQRDKYVYDC